MTPKQCHDTKLVSNTSRRILWIGQAVAKQDDWARITLRIPGALHEQLVAAAGPKSLNAEIVERLQDSIHRDARDAAYLASYTPPSDAEIEEQARSYREWLESEGDAPDSDFDPFEAEIFEELSKVVMKMARRRVEAQKQLPQPPMTPEDFYEYSMAQIEDMPEDERPGAISMLNQTMEKAAKRFNFSWPRDRSGVPF